MLHTLQPSHIARTVCCRGGSGKESTHQPSRNAHMRAEPKLSVSAKVCMIYGRRRVLTTPTAATLPGKSHDHIVFKELLSPGKPRPLSRAASHAFAACAWPFAVEAVRLPPSASPREPATGPYVWFSWRKNPMRQAHRRFHAFTALKTSLSGTAVIR